MKRDQSKVPAAVSVALSEFGKRVREGSARVVLETGEVLDTCPPAVWLAFSEAVDDLAGEVAERILDAASVKLTASVTWDEQEQAVVVKFDQTGAGRLAATIVRLDRKQPPLPGLDGDDEGPDG